jgi:hypothetical protein
MTLSRDVRLNGLFFNNQAKWPDKPVACGTIEADEGAALTNTWALA